MISERLRTVQDGLHRLGPWFDPRSRRPLVLLTLVSFAVYFWPLAADVASAALLRDPLGAALVARPGGDRGALRGRRRAAVLGPTGGCLAVAGTGRGEHRRGPMDSLGPAT